MSLHNSPFSCKKGSCPRASSDRVLAHRISAVMSNSSRCPLGGRRLVLQGHSTVVDVVAGRHAHDVALALDVLGQHHRAGADFADLAIARFALVLTHEAN